MENKIKVIQHGVGAKGKLMVGLMLRKADLEIVGAVDITNVGKDVGEVIGHTEKMGVVISDNLEKVLADTKPDIMLDASLPYTKQFYSIFKKALEAKVNIISIAPQAFNPWVNEPELAEKLEKMAKENGVTIVGTGTGPGFYYDILPLFFTGVCGEVKKITCERIADASETGPSYRKRCGYGFSREEAEAKLQSGEVKLNLAYPDEIHFVANCLGWKEIEVLEEKEFLISKVVRDHRPHYIIEPGHVCGYRHDCYGVKDGETVIEIKSIMTIDPFLDGLETCYKLSIDGEPSLSVDVPGLALGKNIPMMVAAAAVNRIPHIVKADPGLFTDARHFPFVTCLP